MNSILIGILAFLVLTLIMLVYIYAVLTRDKEYHFKKFGINFNIYITKGTWKI